MRTIVSFILSILLFFSFSINIFAEEIPQISLKSEAAALLDSETNAVLYVKNADVKMYPASVTKIATAIYAIEKGDLNSIVTVSANAVNQDGTRVYLNEGEQVPLKKLIQGMLVNSGNDAAVAIAEHLDGSVERFSENINEYLKIKIGVKNTHFTNPSGLFDENHYTTAMDLALITNYAIKNPFFAETFGTKVLPWEGQAWKTTLLTHHRMLKGELPYPGVTGGKTGYTTESRQTLSTTADNGKIKLTAVVLKSDLKQDKYDDTAVLFDYGFKSFQHAFIKKDEMYKNGNKEYYPDNDTLITEDVNGAVKKVDSSGLLSIENNSGRVLQQVQLTFNDPKPKANPQKNIQAKAKAQQFSSIYILYGLIIIAFTGVIMGVSRKFTKKAKSNSSM